MDKCFGWCYNHSYGWLINCCIRLNLSRLLLISCQSTH
jgi:hypothetical protein